MRVAQLVCSHGFAGVERYIATLGTELVGLGTASVVIGGDPGSMRTLLAGTGVAWLPGSSVAEAARSLARTGVDLVNAHMTQAELVAAGCTALRRTPVVATRHFAAPRGTGRAGRLLARVAESRIGAEIAISDYVVGRIARPATVIHSGVPVTAGTRPVGARERAVLVAQRLQPEKATVVALEAWARSRARRDGWRLWVAGDGTEAAALRERAEQLGIGGDVDFLGRRTDLPHLMERAGLLLATAPAEPLGLTVLEAMSHALPVVATGTGGHAETLAEVGRPWCYDPGDAAGAAAMIDALAADEAARERLGVELRHRQRQRFTLRRQAEQTLAVYRDLL